ncbi:MAG TPA: hypothetical protein PK156_22490 [Polyangium sp.]|nr:hypothetical protein [Polyangium sp.]
MLPPLFFAALPAQVDATVTLAPTASAVTGTTGTNHFNMALAAVEGSSWLRVVRPRSSCTIDLSGHYGLALFSTGLKSPPRDLSVRARTRFDLVSSPRTNFVFLADGYIASRIGLRATDDLAVRDPFSVSRVLDGWSVQSSFFGRLVPRASLHLDLRYAQTGAVTADLPTAVGIDTHAVMFSASTAFQWSRRVSGGPVARLGWTHFNHALVDTNLTRGIAEVNSLSVTGFLRYDATPRTRASVVAGATIASAPPGAKDLRTITSPEVRLEIRALGRRIGGTGSVALGYQSVGPRIGFGMDYSGSLEMWMRPFRGGGHRDVLVHGVTRARLARALIPNASANVADSPTKMGRLETTAMACGVSLTGPIRLGWSINIGLDFEYVMTHIDPVPLRGDPPEAFRALVTLGLVASSSTDRNRLLPRDPLAAPDDGRIAAPHRAVRRNDLGAASNVADQSDNEDGEE